MTWLPGTVIEESYEGDWDNDERHGYAFTIVDCSIITVTASVAVTLAMAMAMAL
jgi:hypothetical protein